MMSYLSYYDQSFLSIVVISHSRLQVEYSWTMNFPSEHECGEAETMLMFYNWVELLSSFV